MTHPTESDPHLLIERIQIYNSSIGSHPMDTIHHIPERTSVYPLLPDALADTLHEHPLGHGRVTISTHLQISVSVITLQSFCSGSIKPT